MLSQPERSSLLSTMRSVADGGCRSHRVKVACNPFTCIQSIDNKLALYSHQKPSWLQCICFLSFNNHLSLTLLTPGTSPQDALENDLCLCLCLCLCLSLSLSLWSRIAPFITSSCRSKTSTLLSDSSLSLSLSLSVKRKQYDSNWNIAKQKIWTPQDTEVERKSTTQKHARAHTHTHTQQNARSRHTYGVLYLFLDEIERIQSRHRNGPAFLPAWLPAVSWWSLRDEHKVWWYPPRVLKKSYLQWFEGKLLLANNKRTHAIDQSMDWRKSCKNFGKKKSHFARKKKKKKKFVFFVT